MDYEKMYKDALERAKKALKTCGSLDCDAARLILKLFPQLAESADERVRKAILGLTYLDGIEPILTKCTITAGDIRAWLEKQKDSVSNAKYIEDVANAFEDGRRKGEQKEQKPAEWSEEDKQWLSEVYFAIDHSMYSEDERQAMKKYIDYLRHSWKPSDK